jgi:hypothetical protein
MTVFLVRHLTKYRYKWPVRLGEHRLLFRPRDSFDQRLLQSHLSISPRPARLRWIHDVFGNCVALFDFDISSTYLDIESQIRLDHRLMRKRSCIRSTTMPTNFLISTPASDDNATIRMTACKDGFSVLWDLGGSSRQAVF